MNNYLRGQQEAFLFVKRLDASFSKKKKQKKGYRNQFKGKCPSGKSWVVNSTVKNGGFCRTLPKGALATDDEFNDNYSIYTNDYGGSSYLSKLEKEMIESELGGQDAIEMFEEEQKVSRDTSIEYNRNIANILIDGTLSPSQRDDEITKYNQVYEDQLLGTNKVNYQNVFGSKMYLAPAEELMIKNILSDETSRQEANLIAKKKGKDVAIQYMRDAIAAKRSNDYYGTNDYQDLIKKYQPMLNEVYKEP